MLAASGPPWSCSSAPRALATFINGGGLGILITTGVNLNLPACSWRAR
jgi:ABC-type proline/glycine betaine transport system permease subunit